MSLIGEMEFHARVWEGFIHSEHPGGAVPLELGLVKRREHSTSYAVHVWPAWLMPALIDLYAAGYDFVFAPEWDVPDIPRPKDRESRERSPLILTIGTVARP